MLVINQAQLLQAESIRWEEWKVGTRVEKNEENGIFTTVIYRDESLEETSRAPIEEVQRLLAVGRIRNSYDREQPSRTNDSPPTPWLGHAFFEFRSRRGLIGVSREREECAFRGRRRSPWAEKAIMTGGPVRANLRSRYKTRRGRGKGWSK